MLTSDTINNFHIHITAKNLHKTQHLPFSTVVLEKSTSNRNVEQLEQSGASATIGTSEPLELFEPCDFGVFTSWCIEITSVPVNMRQ